MTDDLIRRQDAIMVVHDLRLEAVGCIPESYNAGVDASASVLEMIPSVQLEPPWTPCSERLPDEKDADEYLITCKDRYGDTFVKKTMYFPEDELWWDISPSLTVTAWMPVPKPYEVDK
ncbi:MAG: DUF551 domain-containing protein [Solobacterium sp.]|nr:DUF551 domain-containing protein [Solobacterium sp.]